MGEGAGSGIEKWRGIGFQATPLLKSCSLELTLRVEHDFKGGHKLSALIPDP